MKTIHRVSYLPKGFMKKYLQLDVGNKVFFWERDGKSEKAASPAQSHTIQNMREMGQGANTALEGEMVDLYGAAISYFGALFALAESGSASGPVVAFGLLVLLHAYAWRSVRHASICIALFDQSLDIKPTKKTAMLLADYKEDVLVWAKYAHPRKYIAKAVWYAAIVGAVLMFFA